MKSLKLKIIEKIQNQRIMRIIYEKLIELFLIDGTADGIVTAVLSN